MFKTRLTLDEDGMVSPPAAPGLGIELDEEHLARHLVARRSGGRRRRGKGMLVRLVLLWEIND